MAATSHVCLSLLVVAWCHLATGATSAATETCTAGSAECFEQQDQQNDNIDMSLVQTNYAIEVGKIDISNKENVGKKEHFDKKEDVGEKESVGKKESVGNKENVDKKEDVGESVGKKEDISKKENVDKKQKSHANATKTRVKKVQRSRAGDMCEDQAAYGQPAQWFGTTSSPTECANGCGATDSKYTKFTYWPSSGGCKCSEESASSSTTTWDSVSGALTCCSACVTSTGGDCRTCKNAERSDSTYTGANGGGYVTKAVEGGDGFWPCHGVCLVPEQNDKTILVGFGLDTFTEISEYTIQVTIGSDGKVDLGSRWYDPHDYEAGDQICLLKQESSNNFQVSLFVNEVQVGYTQKVFLDHSNGLNDVMIDLADGATASMTMKSVVSDWGNTWPLTSLN